MKVKIFIKNALILTGAAFILRIVGMIFRVWLTRKIGSEGIGLYQLIFSVYILAATFTMSGICTAVTRMIAEGDDSRKSVNIIIRKAAVLTVVIAAISTSAVYFSAHAVAERFIGTADAEKALKIMAFSLPFMGLTSLMRGFFIARRKPVFQCVSQIFEQVIRIAVVMFLITRPSVKSLSDTAAAILFGDTSAEALACIFLFFLYRRSLKTLPKKGKTPKKVTSKILSIALPITGSKYITNGLHTAENLLVPVSVALFCGSKSSAVAQFGALRGMALPVVFFPASFLTAVSTLMLPEVSYANANGNTEEANKIISKSVYITLYASIITAFIFCSCSKQLAYIFYGSYETSPYILGLSIVIPFMYLESVSDGMLKGLGQQLHSFVYNVCDCIIRVVLVILVVPKTGIMGFLIIMMVSNVFTCTLNTRRLFVASKCRFDFIKMTLQPLVFGAVSVFLGRIVSKNISNDILYLLVCGVLSVVCYAALIFAFGIKKEQSQKRLLSSNI